MHERTTRKNVTFLHPFALRDAGEALDAGSYLVETLEERIEGLSFVAFRRVSTTITITSKAFGSAARQVVEIDPGDLEAALALDAQIEAQTEDMPDLGPLSGPAAYETPVLPDFLKRTPT